MSGPSLSLTPDPSLKTITGLKDQLDDSEMLDDDVEEEMVVDISHEAVDIRYNAAKLIRSELKDFACLERTRLQQPNEGEQNESDEDFSLNISYEAAFKRTMKNVYNFVAWLLTDKCPEVGDREGKVSLNVTRTSPESMSGHNSCSD